MLQVTLYTSLKLHGRTTELPRSDFNRQVIRFTRHTLQVRSISDPSGLTITICNGESFAAYLLSNSLRTARPIFSIT